MRPAEYMALDRQEKAFIIACIDEKVAQDEKALKEAKHKRKGR